MTLKFLYTNSEGRACIIHALPKEAIERVLGPLTDEEYRQHVLERSVPADATDLKEITADDIPADRSFRDAWVAGKDAPIDHCMVKSKEILLNKVRRVRNKELEVSDALYVRATEKNDKDEISALKKHRQQLRDCTEDIKAAEFKDLDEVKAAWPTLLDNPDKM